MPSGLWYTESCPVLPQYRITQLKMSIAPRLKSCSIQSVLYSFYISRLKFNMAQYQRARCNFVHIILSLRKMVMLSLLILGVAHRRIRPVNLRTFSLQSHLLLTPLWQCAVEPWEPIGSNHVICFDAFLRLEEFVEPLNDTCLEAKSNISHKGKETN